MGDLPGARVNPSRPFSSVAVDYAGPFDIKDGKLRSRKIIKSYICLFVCQAVKAVHIEVVSDLTSDGFLSMLKRFVSRRGIPSNIYSDNATCFVGGKNELVKLQNLTKSNGFDHYLSDNQIKWHFMPARSPHFGGLHEAAVKSCKHHLKRVLNRGLLHYEGFYTLTSQIEAILNSRPLVSIFSDPNDSEVLTPAHFLMGQELTAIPEVRHETDSKVNFTSRYRYLQLIGQQLWSRWRKEYLNTLQQRTKWQFAVDPKMCVGRLVLMKEDNVSTLHWPMARIIEVHPGRDNIVRVVTVQTNEGAFKREITKLCLIPMEGD
uniref:Integrase catalytic domain-containing protein n=1 Tax=Dendroctonus ponderosae TaxID=77166 RepID=A0AAR5P578_DENPD